jgi:hypothetical protein
VSLKLDRLHIGLSSWIVQDGNYPDFEVGRNYEFALEFGLSEVEATESSQSNSLRHIEGSDYDFTGSLVFLREEVAVLDVGILCFKESPSRKLGEDGQNLSGRIYLGVDPFFYKESLCDIPGIPGLSYSWTLDDILLETTPWRVTMQEGRRFHERRDDVPRTFRCVRRTDAWNDDNGSGHYVLVCAPRGPAR